MPKYIITYLISYTNVSITIYCTINKIHCAHWTDVYWPFKIMDWLALLTIKNHVVRGTNFVNRHTFREMLYRAIRFFKNLGNTAAEQALTKQSNYDTK